MVLLVPVSSGVNNRNHVFSTDTMWSHTFSLMTQKVLKFCLKILRDWLHNFLLQANMNLNAINQDATFVP